MKRIALALLASALFTLGLFWVMHRMVSGPAELQRPDQDRAVVDFVRLKQDSQTELKERRKPEPPKPQKPKLPQESVSQQDVPMQQIPFKVPQVTPDLSLSQQSLLGDAVVGLGFGDSDVIPLVRMNAVYPQRALRQKIEGFVTARLQITPEVRSNRWILLRRSRAVCLSAKPSGHSINTSSNPRWKMVARSRKPRPKPLNLSWGIPDVVYSVLPVLV